MSVPKLLERNSFVPLLLRNELNSVYNVARSVSQWLTGKKLQSFEHIIYITFALREVNTA